MNQILSQKNLSLTYLQKIFHTPQYDHTYLVLIKNPPQTQKFLHSLQVTMLLLIPSACFICISRSFIYISLCFYLYTKGEDTRDGSEFIYIPLCFYLYRILLPGLTSHKLDLHSTMLLLIPIRRSYLSVRMSYLHSTMLLLIRKGMNPKMYTIDNLHSTMLLLIPVPPLTSA